VYLQNPIYNGVLTITTLVYTVSLYLLDVDSDLSLKLDESAIEIPGLILSLIFLVDLIANLACFGFKRIWNEHSILIFEIFLSFTYWTSYVLDVWVFEDPTTWGHFTRINAIFQLRNLRTVELLSELKDF